MRTVYGNAICNGLNGSLNIGYDYEIEIYSDHFEVPKSDYNLYQYPLNTLSVYFKLYLSKKEFISLMKENLSITDEDIVEYIEYDSTDVICFKYKHDFIYCYLSDTFSKNITKVRVKIMSNNLDRQGEFEIKLFRENIDKFCDLLKLMQK